MTTNTNKHSATSLFDPKIVGPAFVAAFGKLNPLALWRNPVVFAIEVIAVYVTILFARDLMAGGKDALFSGQIAFWLWATVLFATFAEAVAEGRGKAQAASLRRARAELTARRVINGVAQKESVSAADLKLGDLVEIVAGEFVPADGEVVEGVATVDESAITGESAPVIRESGGDRSAVTAGTRVLSDRIVVKVAAVAGSTFLDRMIALVEGASRRKTPNEIALGVLLAGLSLIFVLAVATIPSFAAYANGNVSAVALASLFIALIPTTIGGLLSAIGIAGMDRLVRFNVLAMSGRAVEAAGDVDVLLLDKTGTITLGDRQAVAFLPAPGVDERTLADAAQLASLSDETPEGRSIVVLAKQRFDMRGREMAPAHATFIPFSAQTRMSGVDVADAQIRKGAVDAVLAYVASRPDGRTAPGEVKAAADAIARQGGTPLAVSRNGVVLGVVHLKDIVKGGVKERFAALRAMGIRTVMITGDNPLTAAAIAAEAGVDDFLAQAKPEDKLALIRKEQAEGKLVAMCGDGTNDAPALAQADVGVAMQTGTPAAGDRQAVAFLPAPGVDERTLADAAQLASLSDETPEGRSIVVLAKQRFDMRGREMAPAHATFIPFSAQTRMSGVDVADAQIRKGAVDAVLAYVASRPDGRTAPGEVKAAADAIARQGGTPLAVSRNGVVLGVVHLKDIVKGGVKERFAALRAMGIRTVMITGDNPLTAAAIAAEAGVDDFLAQAKPEDKLALIRKEQAEGKLVAMCGDGTNDAPALAQADVGVAMQTGTPAAREAGNMVDLDSDPTKLIEIVSIGKQLLMTRGSLTTFSIANDVAKYFAIIPAMFAVLYPSLNALNIMKLSSPQSAVLSAIIFNAIVIPALIPLALKGVAWRPAPAGKLLARNLAIYGLGGVIVPFVGIKAIDLVLSAIGLA